MINTNTEEELKMYTLYGHPHHKDGILQGSREKAERSKEKFDGKITEQVKLVH